MTLNGFQCLPQKSALSVWAYRTAAARSQKNVVELLVSTWGSPSPPELSSEEWHDYMVALVAAGKARSQTRMVVCDRRSA